MKKLFIIGAGQYQLPLIIKAKQEGVKVIAVDADSSAPGLKVSDVGIVCNIKDQEKLCLLARDYKVDGVTSLCVEAAVKPVSYICNKLGLPSISYDAALKATNKAFMRDRFCTHGIDVPKYKVISAKDPLDNIIEGFSFPLVVKPVDSSGSRGVTKVEKLSGLRNAIEESLIFSTSGKVIVEDYIEGQEVSVELFTLEKKHHVLQVCEKKRTPPPHLLDTHVFFPCQKSANDINMIINLAKEMANAIGIDFGPSHSEIIMSEKGPMPVEIAARGAGFKVYSDIIPLVTGIDTLKILIDSALGRTSSIAETKDKTAILGFLKAKPGLLKSIHGVDKAKRIRGVYEIEMLRNLGDTIKPLKSGNDRDGYYIVYADDFKTCVNLSGHIEDIIIFEVC